MEPETYILNKQGKIAEAITVYKKETASGSILRTATRPQTNEKILGIAAVVEDASAND